MRRVVKFALAGLLLLIAGVALLLVLGRPAPVSGVQTEQASAPDPGDTPLLLRIWYPANSDGKRKLPLIVISHGTGSSSVAHADTASALAKAGFVVAAVEHTGDNYRDIGHVGTGTQLPERPRHVSRTIDHMLKQWPKRGKIDPERIGMFGHSAGGFTALVIAGAKPELSRGIAYCKQNPKAWTCQYLKSNGFDLKQLGKIKGSGWQADPRVKVAVIAAPAIGYSIDRAALSEVRIPFQIWAAEHDAIVDDSPDVICRAFAQSPEFHLVKGGGHFSFLEPCNLQMRTIITVMHWFGTDAICTDPAGFDRTEFHESFNKSVREHFERTLTPVQGAK